MKLSFGNVKSRFFGKISKGSLTSTIRNTVYIVSLISLIISLFAVTAMSIQKAVVSSDPAGNEYDTEFVVNFATEKVSLPPETYSDNLPKGGMLVKQKKYEYKNGNIMILDITNRTSNAYTVTIEAHYLNGNGEIIRNETRVFEGFPSGYQNYFVFNPGISFSGFTFELSGIKYTGESYAEYFTPGDTAVVRTCWGHVDERGEYIIPMGEEQVNAFPRNIMIDVIVADNMLKPCEKMLTVVGDVVVFDNNGDVCYIADGRQSVRNDPDGSDEEISVGVSAFPPIVTDEPRPVYWPSGANINMWPIPEDLTDATVIYAVKEVYPTYEQSTKFPRHKQYWRAP